MKTLAQRIQSITIFRTLRFRLASTFLLLLTFITIALGLVGTALLRTILAGQSEQALGDELAALRGYIHFDENDGHPYWFADMSDPDEAAAAALGDPVAPLRRVRGRARRRRTLRTPTRRTLLPSI